KLSTTRDMDYVNAARVIASNLLGKHPEDAMAYLKRLESYDPELYQALAPQIERAASDTRPYKERTVAEVRDAADAVDALWTMSRRTRQIEIEGKRLDRDQAVVELQQHAAPMIEPGAGQRGYNEAVTKWEKSKIEWMGVASALRRVEHWIDAM